MLLRGNTYALEPLQRTYECLIPVSKPICVTTLERGNKKKRRHFNVLSSIFQMSDYGTTAACHFITNNGLRPVGPTPRREQTDFILRRSIFDRDRQRTTVHHRILPFHEIMLFSFVRLPVSPQFLVPPNMRQILDKSNHGLTKISG